MKLIGIDTSTNNLSVCISDSEDLLIEYNLSTMDGHLENLFQFTDACMKRTKLTLDDIDGIAYNFGPGSFTGLRIGLAFVKGLIFSRPIKLFCYTIFDQLIFNFNKQREFDGEIITLIQAKRDEFYFATHKIIKKEISLINNINLVNLDNLNSLVNISKNLLILEENKNINNLMKLFPNINTINTNAFAGNLLVLQNKEKYLKDNIDMTEPYYFKEFIPKTKK